jgi:hypothetical protein
MAEQISRRAQNVTGAPFEGAFENQLLRFGSKGLNLAISLDAMEGWSRLTNIWHQNEGEATTRPGQFARWTHGGSPTHSIRRLHVPRGPSTRFWGVGTSLHRGGLGATTSIDGGYSGNPLALLPHRPTLSGDPWLFVGDSAKMAKARGDGLVLPIGLPAPSAAPVSALDTEYRTLVCQFEAADGTDAANWTGTPGTDTAGHDAAAPIVEDSTIIPPFSDSTSLCRFKNTPGAATSTYDTWWGAAVSADMTQVSLYPTGLGPRAATDDDVVHFWMFFSLPHLLSEMRIYFVCSPDFAPTVLPGTVGDVGGNDDAYYKAFRPHDFAQAIQGHLAQVEASESARVKAVRDQDLKTRGIGDIRDTWAELRAVKDPKRAVSLAAAGGSYQWFEFGTVGSPLRRGDFQRIGVTPGRDWSTITGIIVYVRMDIDERDAEGVLGLDDLYLTGGFGPDTIEPGAQQYDYRVTHYDPRTGCESNGSPEQLPAAYLDSVRRPIVIDPPAYGDGAVRQRFYRRGGSIIDDWYFLGENTADGATFTDRLSDAETVTAGTLPTDHFQPIPTVDNDGTTILAQPLPALWGPIEGMLFGCGDLYRPGHVYYSMPDAPDHWSSSGNTEVCAPSEELMNGGVAGHQGFVFSRSRLYLLYPNLSGQSGTVTATPSLCTRGLLGRWAMTVGPGGLVFFVAEDGVFVTQGGPEERLSEAINPLFYGTVVNGYQPIDKAAVTALRLTCWENDLYFLYQDLTGARQVLVYSILQKFWRHYHFTQAPATLQGDDEGILLIGGLSSGKSYEHSGTTDDGTAIACQIRSGALSGGRREEKLFGDAFVDADPGGTVVTVQHFLNEETWANLTTELPTATGRTRFVLDGFGTAPQKAHSISVDVRFTGAVTLYQTGIAMTPQPDLTNRRVTNWDDLNSPDETWVSGVTLDCDTGGGDKVVLVERDFNGTRELIATLTVTADGRHKRKFSWPSVPANQVRLRPEGGCDFWLLYRADWIYLQEPPRIAAWDIHFENQWDQYYTGLDLYCDTFGQTKTIEVWVDEVRLSDPATSNPFFSVTTTGRQVVHLTLPWGRGHVFRFLATDTHPGLLYTHRWHLDPEPTEQANWTQNFSILGTRADKWLKAVIFECDTFNQPKTVQIEVDGTIVETLTVTANGRRVVQLALPTQHLGRVWRMYPIDAHPGRLYSAEPIFDEEPFALDRWETQETNHGLPGWFYPLYAHVTLKSTAAVTLTTVLHHNQVGGTTTQTYVIPATSGQKQRRFLSFLAGKGVLVKYTLTSAAPFWLYRDETTVVVQPWSAARAITVQPFGNDDQDPSRPMTHAVIAARASGGASAGA